MAVDYKFHAGLRKRRYTNASDARLAPYKYADAVRCVVAGAK
jgi:hypothetical protein